MLKLYYILFLKASLNLPFHWDQGNPDFWDHSYPNPTKNFRVRSKPRLDYVIIYMRCICDLFTLAVNWKWGKRVNFQSISYVTHDVGVVTVVMWPQLSIKRFTLLSLPWKIHLRPIIKRGEKIKLDLYYALLYVYLHVIIGLFKNIYSSSDQSDHRHESRMWVQTVIWE